MAHRLSFPLIEPPRLDICHRMYIKRVRKSNRNSKKSYAYLHLVESVRTNNGPRQRPIMNLGKINVSPDQYKELANCIAGKLGVQQELFSADPHIEKLARRAADKMQDKQDAIRTSESQGGPAAAEDRPCKMSSGHKYSQ